MKSTGITVDEAMLALAEALEPKPECGPDFSYHKSEGHIWRTRLIQDISRTFGYYEWIHIDFLHSEAASARLLDAMPGVVLWYLPLNKLWGCVAAKTGEDVNHSDRKTAILLAALKWKQIDIPEGFNCE